MRAWHGSAADFVEFDHSHTGADAVTRREELRDENGNVQFKKNWVVTAFDTKRKENSKKRTEKEAEDKWKEIFGDKKRTSPRGTLTTPPSSPEADGVTLPPSDVSVGKGSEISETEQGKSEKSGDAESTGKCKIN